MAVLCGAYVNEGTTSCASGTEVGDVWYVYTPTFTGEARFQTCGSGFDTTLQLSSGCNGALFDCSDDVGSRGHRSRTIGGPARVLFVHLPPEADLGG